MKILEVLYKKGDFNLSDGAPGNQRGRVINKNSSIKINRGTGWYEERIPSELHIILDNNGKYEKIEIARKFHENIGRITQNRLLKIQNIKDKEINTTNNVELADVVIEEMKKALD